MGILTLIYCCGRYNSSIKINLTPTLEYKKRVLEIVICPNCSKKIAELTITRNDGTEVVHRSKTKTVEKFIQKLMLEATDYNEKVKHGNKGNMFWVFLDNNSNIRDFNNVIKAKFRSECVITN